MGQEGGADMTDAKRKLTERYLRQPYVGAMLRAAQNGRTGGVQHVYVYHDAGCRLLRGHGFCSCSPTVEVRQDGEEC
jgi:hypothetical protein